MQTPWVELFIVVLSLAMTIAVGLHFSKGGSSIQEYMLGNQKISAIPIGLSIVATYLSAASMVTTVQEVYLYGLHIWLMAVIYVACGTVFAYFVLPVSFSVKSASTFEFFERRFKQSHVRKFASLMYAVEMVFHTALCQYIPAATLSQGFRNKSELVEFSISPRQTNNMVKLYNQITGRNHESYSPTPKEVFFSVTGYSLLPIVCGLSFVAWLYTASGGFRAVTYADSFQAIIFIGVTVALFVIGVNKTGTLSEIWRIGTEGHRIEFFDTTPAYDLRYSTPFYIFGAGITSLRAFLSPSFHQRVVAMPHYNDAKRATIWSSILTGLCLLFTYATGVVVYAYYAGCDPLLGGEYLQSYATILTYYVGEIAENIPGLVGLYLSGIIAAGLSSTTSCWNTVSCTLLEDVVTPFLPRKMPKTFRLRIIVTILFLVAFVSTSCVFIIAKIPSLLEATTTMKSFTLSCSITLYTCGMFLPWVNGVGAMVGSSIAALITTYIAYGSQNAKLKGQLINVPKILTNAQCIENGMSFSYLNKTITTGIDHFGMMTVADQNIPWYFKIGFTIYQFPGIIVGIITALMVSYLTGLEDLSKIDREMIIPKLRWLLPVASHEQVRQEEDNDLNVIGNKDDDEV